MAEDVTSILRKKTVHLQPQPEGPISGELASEILRSGERDLALEMPRLEDVLEGRSRLAPIGPDVFEGAVPFGRRGAFKSRTKVGMRGVEE